MLPLHAPVTGDRVLIRQGVLRQLLQQLGSRPPEAGGLLGQRDGVLTCFWFDAGGTCLPDAYLPDTRACERVINDLWRQEGVSLGGFVHSHRDTPCPSVPDRRYMQQVCRAAGAGELLLMILHCGDEPPSLHAWRMQPGEDGLCNAVEEEIQSI